MELNNFIGIFDGAISDEMCVELIDWFEEKEIDAQNDPLALNELNNNSVRDGRVTNGIGMRNDTSHFLQFDNTTDLGQRLRNSVNDCVNEYMIHFPNIKIYQKLYNYDLKIQKTPPQGGYHVWHHEHDTEYPDSNFRLLVWTVYLNDIPEGEGETEFLYQSTKVQPKKGRVCIFPAGFTHPHRGNPPYQKDKYIATGWIKSRVNY